MTTMPTWSDTALAAARNRYLSDDAPSIEEWFRQVSEFVCGTRPPAEREAWSARYFEMLLSRKFLPTTAVLHNAARHSDHLAACTVVPLHADPRDLFGQALPKIVDALLAGTGVGLDLSVLPPRLWEEPTHGRTHAGPVETLRAITQAVDGPIAYAGVKPAAFMGSLLVDHPEIFSFIAAKMHHPLRNVNISVAFDGVFAEAVERDGFLPLRWSERDGEERFFRIEQLEQMHRRARALSAVPPDLSVQDGGVVSAAAGREIGRVFDGVVTVRARALLWFAAECAHACGEPGLLNLEAINLGNPTHPRYMTDASPAAGFGVIQTTAPCAEQPLLPDEACHLGSVNLTAFLSDGGFDFEELGRTVRTAVCFLDDVIDAGSASRASTATLANRKIGIGMMGLADVLFELELPYDSGEGRAFAARIAREVRERAEEGSIALARERGPFPNWFHTRFFRNNLPRRNATLTSIAPTGYISILADCSPGIEPAFRLELGAGDGRFARASLDRKLDELGLTVERWVAASPGDPLREGTGTLASFAGDATGDPAVDARLRQLKRVFRTAHELSPIDHLRMLEAIQPFVDNSISKTINLQGDSTVSDVDTLFRESLRRGIKGITIFRDGCVQAGKAPALEPAAVSAAP